MLDKVKYKLAWEQRVSKVTSHIDFAEGVLEIENLFETYKKAIGKIKLDGKSCIDYGCGGGWLGVYLFDKYTIEKYLGIDISERSIAAAMRNIGGIEGLDSDRYDFLLIEPPSQDLKLEADILFCFSVIQYIPTVEDYKKFLSDLNGFKVKKIFLSIKYGSKTVFQANPYKTTMEIGNACFTNKEDIAKYLTNYKIIKSSEPIEGKYQYITLEAKID